MANGLSEARIAIYTTIAITLTFIAALFIGQSIFLYGAEQGAVEMLKLCKAGHPNCWPTELPKKEPPKPTEETIWPIREYS